MGYWKIKQWLKKVAGLAASTVVEPRFDKKKISNDSLGNWALVN